ncbi:MAG: hypothetical protein Q9170_007273 [Blastenia crenularia]
MKRSSRPGLLERASTIHYQTFPTPPPRSKGQPPSLSPPSSSDGPGHRRHGSSASNNQQSPLPKRQLAILAVIALSEQTALNSISPYLPQMASTFPDVNPDQVGLYVGLIASSFALAQFATNFLWGWISDRIGRKPVVLMGTISTAACFLAFGFCRTLWQAIIVQVIMGLVNGNQGVVSTCLGEITDRSNQSRAFVYLPVIYGLGGITGPLLGGTLVKNGSRFSHHNPYPYLKPNLVSAAVLVVDLILTMYFLEESLEEARNLPPLGKRVGNLFSYAWQFASSSRPSYLRTSRKDHEESSHRDRPSLDGEVESDTDSDGNSHESMPTLLPHNNTDLTRKYVFKRDTLLLLATFLIFQLANISYNSLYPIFGQASPPTGRALSPKEIGVSLAFAGAMTIFFQIAIFGKLRDRMGNKITYRVCLGGMVLAFLLTPWVGYKDASQGDGGISSGKAWLYVELGIVLLIRAVAAVGCLTSALLLITNSAPNHSVLGTINGLAQTLSAAGRAVGPFLSGALFSVAVKVKPKGEALAFCVFGGITFVGFVLSFGVRGEGLEAEGFSDDEAKLHQILQLDKQDSIARQHTTFGSSFLLSMLYFPPLRRLLLPAIVFLIIIVFYRSGLGVSSSLPSFVFHPPLPPPEGTRIPLHEIQPGLFSAINSTENHLIPSSKLYYDLYESNNRTNQVRTTQKPTDQPALKILWQCPIQANRYTNHIRIPAIVRNITQIPPEPLKPENRVFWNPTIISLPYWAENQYLVVSRIVTAGNHQENVMCEANVCHVGSSDTAKAGEKPCTEDDLKLMGPAGGMRCASMPIALNVPPTPAEQCYGKYANYVDVPGFHDPRVFWSGKGEPLMMVNTHLHPPLQELLASSPTHPSLGPLSSYSTLTELTRNPPNTRSHIEKNWLPFFPSTGESYLHYDLTDPKNASARGRTFAKLLGNGFTTANLTDPLELPCLFNTDATETDEAKKGGTWHQASNSLRLILCERKDPHCTPESENTVFFAVIHRKFPNFLDLPLRYERHFMVWSATPPFSMLGISQHPILMANETASGWTQSQNWDDDADNAATVAYTKMHSNSTEPYGGKGYWAYFTYTVSIAYAWGSTGLDEVGDMHVGYLDDEVVLGIGIDDKGQGFTKARASDLVQCLRACPGRMDAGGDDR